MPLMIYYVVATENVCFNIIILLIYYKRKIKKRKIVQQTQIIITVKDFIMLKCMISMRNLLTRILKDDLKK